MYLTRSRAFSVFEFEFEHPLMILHLPESGVLIFAPCNIIMTISPRHVIINNMVGVGDSCHRLYCLHLQVVFMMKRLEVMNVLEVSLGK